MRVDRECGLWAGMLRATPLANAVAAIRAPAPPRGCMGESAEGRKTLPFPLIVVPAPAAMMAGVRVWGLVEVSEAMGMISSQELQRISQSNWWIRMSLAERARSVSLVRGVDTVKCDVLVAKRRTNSWCA